MTKHANFFHTVRAHYRYYQLPLSSPVRRHIHMLATPIIPSLLFYTENYLLFLFYQQTRFRVGVVFRVDNITIRGASYRQSLTQRAASSSRWFLTCACFLYHQLKVRGFVIVTKKKSHCFQLIRKRTAVPLLQLFIFCYCAIFGPQDDTLLDWKHKYEKKQVCSLP